MLGKVHIGIGTIIANLDSSAQVKVINYSRPLKRLKIGDKIFAYMKGIGYVGYGEVTKEAAPINAFIVEEDGKPLLEHDLAARNAGENQDSPEKSEWTVGVKWLKVFSSRRGQNIQGCIRKSKYCM